MEGCGKLIFQRDSVKCGDFYFGATPLCPECTQKLKNNISEGVDAQ